MFFDIIAQNTSPFYNQYMVFSLVILETPKVLCIIRFECLEKVQNSQKNSRNCSLKKIRGKKMIQANNVTLRIGKKALFEDVNIKFTEGNCYGLIGANGAGKSTFLKILSGALETTNGDVTITPGQRLSVLEQDHFKYDAYPVMDVVIMGNERLYQIMKEKEAI